MKLSAFVGKWTSQLSWVEFKPNVCVGKGLPINGRWWFLRCVLISVFVCLTFIK